MRTLIAFPRHNNPAKWKNICENWSIIGGMDRSAEMTAFVRSVDTGGFSAAAREMGLTPSALSKLVTRLEDRLGARLLQRTTRRLHLTPEGESLYVRPPRILA